MAGPERPNKMEKMEEETEKNEGKEGWETGQVAEEKLWTRKEDDIPPNWSASDTFPFQTRKWGKGVRVKLKIGRKTVNDRQSVHMKQC